MIEDIVSHFRSDVTYGYKGDEVTLIADYGNVYIVSDNKGNRFPVHVSRVGDRLLEVIKEEKEVEIVKEPIEQTMSQQPIRPKVKANAKQQSLF